MEHSTGYVLFMYDAKFTNSGPYTCEVIVDTTFDTLMFTKKLLVIGKNSEFYDICSLCLKIIEKVSFNIASEASYVYILSGQKLIKNAKKGPI